ncbi:CNH domain-containing protein [Cokeromyces recurvatus]|uniref:CNH domain-containing protein n=1 Tax=Cokeromyces recurvatus TaxID=90255 RepID=UPI00221F5E24|nr:CNH domain-containing protein [Cokeromyces recurvatus]KAI7903164.1 CNH domain-containing protein [Cokeromyces recurvatus]
MKNTKLILKQPAFNFKLAGIPDDELPVIETTSTSSIATTATACSSDIQYDDCLINNNAVLSKPNELSPSILAYKSELCSLFISKINNLVESRNIFCSTEYPKSFTGEEAVNLLCEIVGNNWTRREYRGIARSLMHIEPPIFAPISYSDKSFKNNKLYDSPKEVYTLTEDSANNIHLSQGLFTPLLDCYNPLCSKNNSNGCYAPLCPNKSSSSLSNLQRNISLTSSIASSQDTFVSKCWSNTVSPETLKKTPAKEMKRQEAIYELIYTEEDYVRDLNLLDELFAKPLLKAQCIERERREEFFKNVFGNYSVIAGIHRKMYRELRDYQLTSQIMDTTGNGVGFIDEIGMIVVKYVNRFMDAYIEYGPHFITAEYIAKKEMASNILFQNFIKEKEKQAETRKLPFRHFIILPITRLQRYPLLLNAILKRTTEEKERQNLTKCINLIKEVASKMDTLTNEAKQALHIQQINDKIRFKPGYPKYRLDLLKPGRQLLYEGPLKRRSHLVVESIDLYVFLFDHLLLMTKPKKYATPNNYDTIEYYMVSKNPIPLELLIIHDVSENFILNSFRTGKGTNSSSNGTATSYSLTSSYSVSTNTNTNNTSQYMNQTALMIRHLGKHGGDYILYADTLSSKLAWREKILNAQNQLNEKEAANRMFEMVTISDTMFAQSCNSLQNHGKITCAASFVSSKGMKMVVLGTQYGVWMGKESDMNGLKQVLTASDVTQMGVLEGQNILLVLADKTLTAYPICQLDPNITSTKLSTNKKLNVGSTRVLSNHVTYFNMGTCNGKSLVVTMKRKGADSQFKVYEVICGDLNDVKNAKYLATKTSFMTKPPAWFRVYKEFYVGTDSSAVHFLKSKLLVACSRGFEVIDLENLSEVKHNLPNLEDKDFSFITTSDAKPFNIFRYNEYFLMCYDKFAFLIDSHGDFVKGKCRKIEWESNPYSVAFYYPYVIAFDNKFVEIRHVETGKLVQVFTGSHIRQLSSAVNNTNAPTSTIYGCMTHQFRSDYQHIFKLSPLFS